MKKVKEKNNKLEDNKMKDLKVKNNFLYSCVSCIMILLVLCYFGINSSVKGTYSAETSYSCPNGGEVYYINSQPGCLKNGYYLIQNEDDYTCRIYVDAVTSIVETYRNQGYTCEEIVTEDGTSYVCNKRITSISDCLESATNNTKYTLTYDSNGGTGGPSSETLPAGDVTVSTTRPTKSGNTFVEWVDPSTGYTYQPGDTYKLVADSKLVAKWRVDTTDVTITLSSLTATYSGQPKKITAATVNPSSTGTITYTYYTDSSCSSKTTSSVGASSNGDAPIDTGTYYVKAVIAATSTHNSASSSCVKLVINKKSVSVSWDSQTTFTYNGSNQGPDATASTGISGETMTITTDKFKDVGTHTSSASCKSVSGGRAKCSNYSLTNTTKEIIISDNVQPLKVTFDYNDGSGREKTATCTPTSKYGECEITFPIITHREYEEYGDVYQLLGWDTQNTCGQYTKDKVVSVEQDIKYYACWKFVSSGDGDNDTSTTQKFIVTFNPNGGILNGNSSKSCTTSSSSCQITGLPTATKNGYTFKGWNTSPSCTSGKTTEITLSSNKTYYACWLKNATTNTDEDGNVTENSKTGEAAILFAWVAGIFAVIYLCRYFKTEKEN